MFMFAIPSGHDFVAFSDGSCLGNPGKGGWAYAIQRNGARSVDDLVTGFGSTPTSTNSRMEIVGALECVLQIGLSERGTVYCDSQYVVKGINEWGDGWIKRGWKTAGNKGVKNDDLWRLLLPALKERPGITFEWVRGHNGNEMNEHVDVLANTAARTQTASAPRPRDLVETTSDGRAPMAETLIQCLMDRATRLLELRADQQPLLERIEDIAGGDHNAMLGFLFGHNRSLGDTPMAVIEAGRGTLVDELLERIKAGVYA